MKLMFGSRRATILVFLASAGAAAYAPLLLLVQRGERAAFQFFAQDAFYYLAVARRSVDAPFFTFDGRHPTNGFHPLWQHLLTGLFHLPGMAEQSAQVLAVFYLSMLLVAVGAGLFGAAVLRRTRSVPAALLTSVPGGLYLLFAVVEPHYGNLWAFVNGMETPATVLLFGALAYLLLAGRVRAGSSLARMLTVSALLTLIVLARLDDGFMIPPVAALLALGPGDWRAHARRFILVCALPAASLCAYLAHNLAYAGAALPVSGLAKGGAALLENLVAITLTLLPITQFGDQWWSGAWAAGAWRSLQLVLPMWAALAWLMRYARRRSLIPPDEQQGCAVLAALCAYVLLKGGYNLANVSLGSQGHWYFPASLMIANLLVSEAVVGVVRRAGPFPSSRGGVPAALLAIIILGNAFVNQKRVTGYHDAFYQFWLHRLETSRAVAALAGAGVLDYDDGIIGYALDVPAMSGIGYALDLEAHRARQSGKLLHLAYTRGFRLLASVSYFQVPDEAGLDDLRLRSILGSAYFMSAEHLGDWKFSVVYRDPGSRTAFIRFEPAAR